MIQYLLFLIIIYVYFMKDKIEGMINEYQFFYCSDRKGEPGTYYRKVFNHVEHERDGFYSDLLDVVEDEQNTGEISRLYQTPICMKVYDYEKNYFNDNMIVDISNNKFKSEFHPLEDVNDFDESYDYNEINYKGEEKNLLLREKLRLDKFISRRNYD